ncbi:MAG: hypothetical protein EU531_09250, partial [Promethearchaeota archaeon]
MEVEELKAHSLEVDKVAKELDTSLENGLTEEEAEKRLSECGLNELRETEGVSAWKIFLSQFQDFLIYLLFFAIGVSVVVGFYELSTGGEASEFLDAIVIFVILIVNAILGFYQEYKA